MSILRVTLLLLLRLPTTLVEPNSNYHPSDRLTVMGLSLLLGEQAEGLPTSSLLDAILL